MVPYQLIYRGKFFSWFALLCIRSIKLLSEYYSSLFNSSLKQPKSREFCLGIERTAVSRDANHQRRQSEVHVNVIST